MAGGDPDLQRRRPDSEPQRRAELHRLAVNSGVDRFRGTDLQTRRAPGSPWRARAVAGRVDDDDPELAAAERRAGAAGQRAVKRVGVVRHENDEQFFLLIHKQRYSSTTIISRPVPRLFRVVARKHDPILRRHPVVGTASGPRVNLAPPITHDLAGDGLRRKNQSRRGILRAGHIVRTNGLNPNLVQQARQPESRFRELVARDHIGVVHVRRAQTDLRFMAALGGRRITRLDWNLQRRIDVGTRDLIRLPRDIVGMSRNPPIERFLACIGLFQTVRCRLLCPNALFKPAHNGGVPGGQSANRPRRNCRPGPRRSRCAAVDGCRRRDGSGTPDHRQRPIGRSSPL